ncbi:MAG TPA: hypothetical protein VIG33_00740 [Pseudobdellovibrionaceae bacterium]|jgi:hypothetical protein
MKSLFLSLLLILSSVILSTASHADQSATPSTSPGFEDVLVRDKKDLDADSNMGLTARELEANRLMFKQKVEEFAMNAFRTPEGRPIIQAEANLLVKYFIELKLPPEALTSYTFHSDLKLPFVGNEAQIKAQRSQVIQTLVNIGQTRTDMDTYLVEDDVRCFYRNFRDTDAVEEVLKLSENAKMMNPLADIFRRSDDVVIVGKCQGCGLLNIKGYPKTPEEEMNPFSACAGDSY